MLIATSSVAQVGINTVLPRKTLEVAGDMEINGSMDIGRVRPVENLGFNTFLVQENDGDIRQLNIANPNSAALGYIQEYVVVDMFEDFIRDFDTGIDANEYVMVAISSFYDQLLVLNGTNQSLHFSLPYTGTFIRNGTWHIIANYPIARNIDTTVEGTWTITTLIFFKDLSKQLGEFVIPMGNTSAGSATTPIIN